MNTTIATISHYNKWKRFNLITFLKTLLGMCELNAERFRSWWEKFVGENLAGNFWLHAILAELIKSVLPSYWEMPFFSFLHFSKALRWLDWIFWGWYLPSLRINYVGMSKDMEKRLPQLYYIKMKISYDLGFIAIGVAMAT